MRKALLVSAVFAASCAFSTAAASQINRFAGRWQNANPGSGGITTLDVRVSGATVTVQAWGQCTPSDCDWGTQPAVAYAPDAGSNVAANAIALSVTYRPGFAETTLVLRPAGMGLRAESFTRFTDASGRSNYIGSDAFRRARIVGPGPRPPRPMPVAEDCIALDPGNVTLQRIGQNWTLVEGNHALFAFGNNRAAALNALATIRHYGMTQSCFVGRPNPSFSYMLVGSQSPAGAFPGEDCIVFDPANVQVQQQQGRWKIVEGGKWMYDFANQAEADQALAIMRKYGFSRQCFVARPNAAFQYLRS